GKTFCSIISPISTISCDRCSASLRSKRSSSCSSCSWLNFIAQRSYRNLINQIFTTQYTQLMIIERNNEWLEEQLAELWYRYFSDVPQPNDVRIKFGQKAATRLGSIKWGRKPVRHANGTVQKRSIITITAHFKDPAIPDDVVRGVIAHELVHYAHGFGGPNPQLYR